MSKKIKFIIFILFLYFIFLLYFVCKNINIENFTSDNKGDNITIVSGYWKVKNKYEDGDERYNEWFNNALKINQRYIFFCEKEMNEYIKSFRGNFETMFVDYPISKFYTNKFYKKEWINEEHVPSNEIGMIWNEKIHLLKFAKDNDEYKTDFYIWVDAGIAPYREMPPPSKRLNLKNIASLPKDKLCFSQVDESYHKFSAGCLIIHRDAIDNFHEKYYEILENCNDGWKCGSDQYIFTLMMIKYPELFYKMSEGYGNNLIELYENHV